MLNNSLDKSFKINLNFLEVHNRGFKALKNIMIQIAKKMKVKKFRKIDTKVF